MYRDWSTVQNNFCQRGKVLAWEEEHFWLGGTPWPRLIPALGDWEEERLELGENVLGRRVKMC